MTAAVRQGGRAPSRSPRARGLGVLLALAAACDAGCGASLSFSAAESPLTPLLTSGTSVPERKADAGAPLTRSRRIAAGVLGGLAAVTLTGAILLTTYDGSPAKSGECSYQGMPARPDRCVWDLRAGYGIGYGVTAGLLAGLGAVLLWPSPRESRPASLGPAASEKPFPGKPLTLEP